MKYIFRIWFNLSLAPYALVYYDLLKCQCLTCVGDVYGPFTMAAIPIGAYQPNWFMKYQHVHPGEALRIHQDIKSNK